MLLSSTFFSTLATSQLLLALIANAESARHGVAYWPSNDVEGIAKYCSLTEDKRVILQFSGEDCTKDDCAPLADALKACKNTLKFIDGDTFTETSKPLADFLSGVAVKETKFEGIYIKNDHPQIKDFVAKILTGESKPQIVVIVSSLQETIAEGATEIKLDFLANEDQSDDVEAAKKWNLPISVLTGTTTAQIKGIDSLKKAGIAYDVEVVKNSNAFPEGNTINESDTETPTQKDNTEKSLVKLPTETPVKPNQIKENSSGSSSDDLKKKESSVDALATNSDDSNKSTSSVKALATNSDDLNKSKTEETSTLPIAIPGSSGMSIDATASLAIPGSNSMSIEATGPIVIPGSNDATATLAVPVSNSSSFVAPAVILTPGLEGTSLSVLATSPTPELISTPIAKVAPSPILELVSSTVAKLIVSTPSASVVSSIDIASASEVKPPRNPIAAVRILIPVNTRTVTETHTVTTSSESCDSNSSCQLATATASFVVRVEVCVSVPTHCFVCQPKETRAFKCLEGNCPADKILPVTQDFGAPVTRVGSSAVAGEGWTLVAEPTARPSVRTITLTSCDESKCRSTEIPVLVEPTHAPVAPHHRPYASSDERDGDSGKLGETESPTSILGQSEGPSNKLGKAHPSSGEQGRSNAPSDKNEDFSGAGDKSGAASPKPAPKSVPASPTGTGAPGPLSPVSKSRPRRSADAAPTTPIENFEGAASKSGFSIFALGALIIALA